MGAEKLNEARAVLDERQARAHASLKEAKAEAKRVRDEAKKNAPDKAARKMADEVYKETNRKAEAESSRVVSAALEDWARVYEEIRASQKEAK